MVPKYIQTPRVQFRPFLFTIALFKLFKTFWGYLYTDRKEETFCANIAGHSNLQAILYYIVMPIVWFDMIMYLNMNKSVDTYTFHPILQIPELLFMFILGDHDDIFNAVFLDFISKAWSLRNDF